MIHTLSRFRSFSIVKSKLLVRSASQFDPVYTDLLQMFADFPALIRLESASLELGGVNLDGYRKSRVGNTTLDLFYDFVDDPSSVG